MDDIKEVLGLPVFWMGMGGTIAVCHDTPQKRGGFRVYQRRRGNWLFVFSEPDPRKAVACARRIF